MLAASERLCLRTWVEAETEEAEHIADVLSECRCGSMFGISVEPPFAYATFPMS